MSGNGFAPDYVDVAERIDKFYEKYPDGRLWAEQIVLTDGYVEFKAYAARTLDDPRPCTGHSGLSIPGSTPYTRGSEIENAETSAIGRAIVMAGIRSKKVASADEVKAKAGSSPVPAPVSAPRPVSAPQTAQAPSGGWTEGQVHEDGHKPVRARQNGSLFCPTKMPNGAWCPWKHDPSSHAPEPAGEPPMMSDAELSEIPF